MPVIGTAGHVDHGKSTLVAALTGRDPDRWAEEKARGLTIDLGFAWTTLPDGTDVSFVDVPGHERFMKNMLAGIEAIDVALLAVDAEEGWMPQTEEHVGVLDLLEVKAGVVALTKADRVDADLVELATLEVAERLAGTTLEKAPIIAVSARTGEGLDDLVSELVRAVSLLPPAGDGRPRMWVDRSFTVAGAGTVVTGTLLDGRLRSGDRVAVFPSGTEARVRGLESHEKTVGSADPRRRVAVNLAGVATAAVPRGAMLGLPGQWRPTKRFLVSLRLPRYVDELPERGAFHVHIGSGAWPARLRVVDPAAALLEVPQALPLKVGDRLILRETGRRLVVGGGRVIDPNPERGPHVRSTAARLAGITALDPDGQAGLLLDVRGRADVAALSAETGGGRASPAVELEGTAFTPGTIAALGAEVTDRVGSYHRANPLRAGMPFAELATETGLGLRALEDLIAGIEGVEVVRDIVRMTDHAPGRAAAQDEAWAAARHVLEQAGAAAAPRALELGLEPDLLHALVRQGELVRVSADIVLLPEDVDRLLDVLRRLAEELGELTVAQFKERSGLSRKYAVPFLEWADREGITLRLGDVRRLRRQP